MNKYFNINADCKPELHYMIDLSEKIQKIKSMVDAGQYFTINRARQYGKTTTLRALEHFLEEEYLVISLDFQMLSHADFENEQNFVAAFSREILENVSKIPEQVKLNFLSFSENTIPNITLSILFKSLKKWCEISEKKLVLMIDEIDSATNNQVFLDFLAQLRGYYIKRGKIATFHSVILAGVYDIKNIKRKIRPDEQQRVNSPWNIATDFLIDMSFSPSEIMGMLADYEKEHQTGMDIFHMAQWIYDYTSGYPFLVSRICKVLDEQLTKNSAWTKEGLLKAIRFLLSEKNTLFESLFHKLQEYPELKKIIYMLLFQGQKILYNPDDSIIDIALMFGVIKVEQDSIVIANRIFETRFYNMFLTIPSAQENVLYKAAFQDKNQFVENGHLNMTRILKKFVQHFDEIYSDQNQKFIEEDGRRYFMLYLKPIINGVGNYYIEARTRNLERTDMIVDYHGEQFIIEMKIWHGNAYNERGEEQLLEYLEYYHLDKGYLLSFNFNKKKEIGVKEIVVGDKILVEAVV